MLIQLSGIEIVSQLTRRRRRSGPSKTCVALIPFFAMACDDHFGLTLRINPRGLCSHSRRLRFHQFTGKSKCASGFPCSGNEVSVSVPVAQSWSESNLSDHSTLSIWFPQAESAGKKECRPSLVGSDYGHCMIRVQRNYCASGKVSTRIFNGDEIGCAVARVLR
jgi:hypothetical protein